MQALINWIRLNRWKMFFILFGFAMAITFIVYNAIQIDKLMVSIQQLDKKNQRLQNKNELLNAELIKLQAPDRIITIAKDKLNLDLPDKAPVIIYNK